MNEDAIVSVLRLLFSVVGRIAPRMAARLACTLLFTPRRFDRPPRESAWIANSTPLKLQCGLAAWSWGEPTHPTVLLIHGWSGRGGQMCAFIDPLLQQGRRVIAIDGDAHGDSPGRRTNPVRFAELILAAGKELGSLDAIIAHSFGAATSSIAIINGLQVSKMVFIAGPATYQQVLDNVGRTLNIPPKAFRSFVKRVEHELGRKIEEMDIGKFVQHANSSALVLHSLDDDEVPYTEGVKIAEAWPNARMVTFENLGHLRILWDPKSVNAAVDFVTGNPIPFEADRLAQG